MGTWRGAGVELVLADDGGFESRGLTFVPPASAAPGPDVVVGNWLLDDRAGPGSDGASIILTVDSPLGTGIIPLELPIEGTPPGLALVVAYKDAESTTLTR